MMVNNNITRFWAASSWKGESRQSDKRVL